MCHLLKCTLPVPLFLVLYAIMYTHTYWNYMDLTIIRKWEGLRLQSYKCPAGIWTIGYGSTKYTDGRPVKPNQKITKEEAEELLLSEVEKIRQALAVRLKFWHLMNDNQKAAVISFAYNFGINFMRVEGFPSMVTLLNNPQQWTNKDLVMRTFRLYIKANGEILQGLLNRRTEEATLFLHQP